MTESEKVQQDLDTIKGWFAGRLPDGWFSGLEVTLEGDQLVVVGRIAEPQLDSAASAQEKAGAAEGQRAPEALFYLKSRGRGEETARALLTYGFTHEVLERVMVEPLQAYVDRLLMARLGSDPITKEIV